MKTCTLALTAFAAGTAFARQGAWQQCGGGSYTGSKRCVSGYKCHVYNEYYHQCIPNNKATSPAEVQPTTMVTSQSSAQDAPPSSAAVVYPASTTPAYIQGPHTASAPAAFSPASSAPAPSSPASSAPASSAASAPAASSSSSSGSGSGGNGGGVSYAGVNIAGFDFGCGTDGTCDLSSTTDPGQNGIDQMNHFVSDDGLNVFRVPVAWQYLVNNQLGGTLDADNFATYNKLVQGCLDAGAALCIIDIHNYARWNAQIIGQGGPTNAQYASLWSQLATKYASNSKVAFGLMNEPHDLTISDWADSVQAAVTAIRKAGATSNKCLLPGTDYTSAAQFIDNGSGAALSKVTNLDGSTDNLIFDVHKYLDSDNSGSSATCTTNNVDAFTALGQWLQSNGRQAMLTETGGGASDGTCLTKLCEELATLNKFSDVFLGWVGWSAGAFDTSYVLTETPEGSKGSFTDQPLVKQCIVGQFKG